jgi:hypothetical protein
VATRAGSDRRRRRRGPQVRQERAPAAWINRAKRTLRRGRSTPPEGGHETAPWLGPAFSPGSRGLHAPERCAGRRSRRSRASVRAAISWNEQAGFSPQSGPAARLRIAPGSGISKRGRLPIGWLTRLEPGSLAGSQGVGLGPLREPVGVLAPTGACARCGSAAPGGCRGRRTPRGSRTDSAAHAPAPGPADRRPSCRAVRGSLPPGTRCCGCSRNSSPDRA